MNFQELNQTLYSYTPSEQHYKQTGNSAIYAGNPQISINNKKVYRFSKDEMIKHFSDIKISEFFIRKQSRFTPVPNHVTDVLEINYIYHGSCTQYINDKKILLEEGDLIIVDTETMHATEAPQETDIVISLNISQQFFKDNFLDSVREASQLSQFLFQAISDSQNHNQYLLFRGKDTEKIHLLFEQLLCEVYDPSMLHLEIKTQFIKLILFELICSSSVEANGITSNVQEQQLIIDILAYIDRHYSSVTLTSCAQHFGYNPSYFSTLIKKLTSQTFKQLVNQKKLEESLPLLLHSNESTHDIALHVGFSNLNTYYKVFQEKYGTTPANYRLEKKNSASLHK